MTEQKPPGTSWESWIEDLIRRARKEGQFDQLEGAGKPSDLPASRVAALNAEIARMNARVAEGPPTRLATLDADAIVAEWRRRSSSAG